MGRLVGALRASLEAPRVICIAAAVALVLSLSTLGNGLVLDDYFQQRVALEGRGYFADVPVHALDMFAFLPSGMGCTSGGSKRACGRGGCRRSRFSSFDR